MKYDDGIYGAESGDGFPGAGKRAVLRKRAVKAAGAAGGGNYGGKFTARQRALLGVLAKRPGEWISTCDLVTEALGPPFNNRCNWTATLDVLKHNLRVHPGTHGLPPEGDWRLERMPQPGSNWVLWRLVDHHALNSES